MREKEYVLRLAREAVEAKAMGKGKILIPDWVPESLRNRRAAVFVSLKKDKKLRGCIGTLKPSSSALAQEIIDMAVEASSRDPRFPKIRPEELNDLRYSVDLLFEPQPVDHIEDLDPQRYGVLVIKDFKRGVLLPRLEGIETSQQQVYIALKKAGISPDEGYRMERFEVIRYEEEEEDDR